MVGPYQPIKFLEFIEIARETLNPKLKLNLIDKSKIKEEDRHVSFPMYYRPEYFGAFQVDGKKAFETGLKKIDATSTILTAAAYLKKLPI